MRKIIAGALFAFTTAIVQPALAEINIGVTVSATGPAASLGIPEKNTVSLLPTTMGGQKVNYIVLDDATIRPKPIKTQSDLLLSIRLMQLLAQRPRQPRLPRLKSALSLARP